MEEILRGLGISENTISQMEELCPNIKELSKEEIEKKIEKLKEMKCDDIQVRNIISSNAIYLDRSVTDVDKLINTMKDLGFDNLNILLDGNPYILNLDDFEIKNYITKREEKGELLEDIVDDMSTNPFLFEEI